MTQPDHTLDVPKAENVDTFDPQLVTRVPNEGQSIEEADIVVMKPKLRMSKREALVHAATIVAIADLSENYSEFRSILKAVLEA